ncbi:tyrosine-type recombinase/integrase [Oceanobacillus oncorhynchi subsp. oncorhynchi]|uniref:tyrosine-type recombinase/integrase n=1 Tax=Oceanobacillus oncorhynchi TaxID=545501 RepID=UPI00363B1088
MAIKPKEDGKFIVDVSAGTDPITGKQRRFRPTVDTKEQAEDLEYQLIQKYNRGNEYIVRDLNFQALTTIYLEDCKLHGKPAYHENQTHLINKHLTPYFIKSNIPKITKEDIKEFQQHLINSGLNNKTINNIMITVSSIFDVAVDENVIDKNPCKGVKNLSIEQKQMKFWTPNQFKEFISLIDDEKEFLFKVYYTTAYFTGMRCGELLALNWNDIDTFRKEINVYKSLTYIKKEVIINKPKTKNSIRRISINAKLLELLLKWKREQQILFEKYQLKHSDEIHVFQYREIPPTKDIFSRRIRKICERGNLEPIRQHDLRHSHVALLIHQGEDHVTIKERLGHSSITTTIDVYGHLFPNKQRETADKLDDFF